jgi:hypothetical protein
MDGAETKTTHNLFVRVAVNPSFNPIILSLLLCILSEQK